MADLRFRVVKVKPRFFRLIGPRPVPMWWQTMHEARTAAEDLNGGLMLAVDTGVCGACGRSIRRWRSVDGSSELEVMCVDLENGKVDWPPPLPEHTWRHDLRGVGHRATPSDWGYAEKPVNPWDMRQ